MFGRMIPTGTVLCFLLREERIATTGLRNRRHRRCLIAFCITQPTRIATDYRFCGRGFIRLSRSENRHTQADPARQKISSPSDRQQQAGVELQAILKKKFRTEIVASAEIESLVQYTDDYPTPIGGVPRGLGICRSRVGKQAAVDLVPEAEDIIASRSSPKPRTLSPRRSACSPSGIP